MSWFEQVTSKHKVLFNATSLPRDAKAQTVQQRDEKRLFLHCFGQCGNFFRPFGICFLRNNFILILITSEVKEMDAGSSNGAGVGRSRHAEAGENASVSR